ncbi:MAG: metallophosphoesterase [Bacilli bacterium]|nr:metallophosphoesterase [Bacilli bacterium]
MDINMTKGIKYFIISDIHGHFDEMILSLSRAGFDQNKKHILIVLGDMFDRGNQSKEVLEYLYKLCMEKKCYVVIGNHDVFLLELIDENYSRVEFNIQYNGFSHTLISLSGKTYSSSFDLPQIRSEIINNYPFLYEWINHLPNYIEIGNYILVHGGIDGSKDDWKTSSRRDFVWSYESSLQRVMDKIVVAGHQRTATIHNKNCNYHDLFKEQPDEFGIMFLEGKILIDGFVEVSKNINVLLIEG